MPKGLLWLNLICGNPTSLSSLCMLRPLKAARCQCAVRFGVQCTLWKSGFCTVRQYIVFPVWQFNTNVKINHQVDFLFHNLTRFIFVSVLTNNLPKIKRRVWLDLSECHAHKQEIYQTVLTEMMHFVPLCDRSLPLAQYQSVPRPYSSVRARPGRPQKRKRRPGETWSPILGNWGRADAQLGSNY